MNKSVVELVETRAADGELFSGFVRMAVHVLLQKHGIDRVLPSPEPCFLPMMKPQTEHILEAEKW